MFYPKSHLSSAIFEAISCLKVVKCMQYKKHKKIPLKMFVVPFVANLSAGGGELVPLVPCFSSFNCIVRVTVDLAKTLFTF